MTRFARAKGSKSSNERKPEEATSWSEMKKEMLSKRQKTVPEKEEVKVEPRKCVETEWASLGDDSSSLLKRNKKSCAIKNKKEKCVNSCEQSVEMNSFKKNKVKEGLKESVNRKGKKRKWSEGDSNEFPNKKAPTDGHQGMKEEKEVTKTSKKKKKFEKGGKGMKNRSKQGKLTKKFNKSSYNEKNTIVEEIIVNGNKVPIVKFQGFNVTQEDAERLRKLHEDMIKEGIPKNKLEAAIKLERRRAEKALSRLKKALCFHCRGSGHLLSNCPTLAENQNTGTGICYKCGSTEHSALSCKVVRDMNFQFAECFICREQGHIAKQCPDNPRGLYPRGGACRECGDVTHLRKDCPSKKTEEEVTLGVRRDRDFECLDEEIAEREKLKSTQKPTKKNLIVKF